MDTVSTVRGWVRSLWIPARLRRTHLLPRTVLTVSKCEMDFLRQSLISLIN